MPHVFEAVPLRASLRQRQDRVPTIDGLNLGLFIDAIDAEDRRVLGRRQIHANDFGGLLLEVRIGRPQVAFQPVRLQNRRAFTRGRRSCGGTPRAFPQSSGRPVRGAIRRRLPCPTQDAGLDLRRQHPKLRPMMPAAQALRPSWGYRAFHVTIVCAVQSTRSLAGWTDHPSASNRIIRARRASSARPRCDRASASSSRRSSRDSFTEVEIGTG